MTPFLTTSAESALSVEGGLIGAEASCAVSSATSVITVAGVSSVELPLLAQHAVGRVGGDIVMTAAMLKITMC